MSHAEIGFKVSWIRSVFNFLDIRFGIFDVQQANSIAMKHRKILKYLGGMYGYETKLAKIEETHFWLILGLYFVPAPSLECTRIWYFFKWTHPQAKWQEPIPFNLYFQSCMQLTKTFFICCRCWSKIITTIMEIWNWFCETHAYCPIISIKTN